MAVSDTISRGHFNWKRIAVAAGILPGLVAYIYFLPAVPYFLMLLIIAGILAMREFFVMYGLPIHLYIPGIVAGAALIFIICQYPEFFFEGLSIAVCIILLLRLLLFASPSGSMSHLGPLGMGLLYVAGFTGFQWFVRTGQYGMQYILLLYASVWIADSMAYYVGKYLGRIKLYPAVSPKKTVEGAVGSVIGGGIGAILIRTVLHVPDLSFRRALTTGAVLGAAAICGDLIESMFKRDAGVKDSGTLLPGHGGMLDKMDGLLVSGPVLYFIMRYL